MTLNASARAGASSLTSCVADHFAVLVDHRDAAVLARVGQVVDDGVEQLLHALVLERRAAEHRHELAGDRALADALLEHARVELAVLDELHERFLVHRERVLEQFLAQLGIRSIQSLSAVDANLKRPSIWSSGTVSHFASLSSESQM